MNYGEFVNRMMLNPMVTDPLDEPVTIPYLLELLKESQVNHPKGIVAVLIGSKVWTGIVASMHELVLEPSLNREEVHQGLVGYIRTNGYKVSIITDAYLHPLLRGCIESCAIVLRWNGTSELFEVKQ